LLGKFDNLLTRIRHLLQHRPHAPGTLLPGVRLYPDALGVIHLTKLAVNEIGYLLEHLRAIGRSLQVLRSDRL
jgi:hypothetical protein